MPALARPPAQWLAPIKPHLQHLAAASSAGTSLEANLKHINVTLATWEAVWELEEDMAEVSMERNGRAEQLVVFFGLTQQPGSHTTSSLRAWAQHSPASQSQQAHQS
ncbi:hypothetical protein HaLaN_25223 [Haematococcus lacustris]|uniref:Uncharacterized protein n=1 Tax=Haematococcus lacustris TaxID=44745 RepID=A0A6A0A498_HAELA|nr:hypothetical protein HaLaN_25223 [Haematococcus lacustris]